MNSFRQPNPLLNLEKDEDVQEYISAADFIDPKFKKDPDTIRLLRNDEGSYVVENFRPFHDGTNYSGLGWDFVNHRFLLFRSYNDFLGACYLSRRDKEYDPFRIVSKENLLRVSYRDDPIPWLFTQEGQIFEDDMPFFPIGVPPNFKMPGSKMDFGGVASLLMAFISSRKETKNNYPSLRVPLPCDRELEISGLTTPFYSLKNKTVGPQHETNSLRIVCMLTGHNHLFHAFWFTPAFMTEVVGEFCERCLAKPDSLIYLLTARRRTRRAEIEGAKTVRRHCLMIAE